MWCSGACFEVPEQLLNVVRQGQVSRAAEGVTSSQPIREVVLIRQLLGCMGTESCFVFNLICARIQKLIAYSTSPVLPRCHKLYLPGAVSAFLDTALHETKNAGLFRIGLRSLGPFHRAGQRSDLTLANLWTRDSRHSEVPDRAQHDMETSTVNMAEPVPILLQVPLI